MYFQVQYFYSIIILTSCLGVVYSNFSLYVIYNYKSIVHFYLIGWTETDVLNLNVYLSHNQILTILFFIVPKLLIIF